MNLSFMFIYVYNDFIIILLCASKVNIKQKQTTTKNETMFKMSLFLCGEVNISMQSKIVFLNKKYICCNNQISILFDFQIHFFYDFIFANVYRAGIDRLPTKMYTRPR